MQILSLSLDEGFHQPEGGEVRERHRAYVKELALLRGGEAIQLNVIAYSGRGIPRTVNTATVNTATVNIGCETLKVYPSMSFNKLGYLLDAIRRGAEVCREKQIDLIIAQDPFITALAGVVLKRRFAIPLIVENHTSFVDDAEWASEHPLRARVLRLLSKVTLRCADQLRVVNQSEREQYVAKGLKPERIVVQSVPVDLSLFSQKTAGEAGNDQAVRQRIRAECGIGSESPLLIWVGRPVPSKGLPTLLSAFRYVLQAVPDCRLLLIGKQLAACQDISCLVHKLGISKEVILLREGVRHSLLSDYYQSADIFVMTSHYEGFGRTLVEAAASALPVVTTDTAGAREVFGESPNVLFVRVRGERELADRILFLLRNPELARAMGANLAAEVSERFSFESGLKGVAEVWNSAARQGGRRA